MIYNTNLFAIQIILNNKRRDLMQPLKQTRFLAANYPSLQGLKIIPPALALLLVSLWANGQHSPAHNPALPILFTLGSFALLIPIEYYYAHAFGRVKLTFASYWLEYTLALITGILALGAFWAENTFKLPISLIGLALSTVFLSSAFVTWREEKWLLAAGLSMAALMTVVSILPLLGAADWWSAVGMRNQILGETVVFSILIIISGILSHISFTSSLPSASEATDE
jgi:hypothetical protein